MDFRLESWRKLYLRENLDQQGWPVFARGLRDLLVRLAKDDGTIVARTEAPAVDLAATLKANETEWPMVVDACERMLADGYLSHETFRLFITRHEEGQARNTSTPRVRKHRAKAAESAKSETLPKHVTKRDHETDPTRPDPTRNDPPIRSPQGDKHAHGIIAAWANYTDRRAARWPKTRALKLTAKRRSHLRRRLEDFGLERVVEAINKFCDPAFFWGSTGAAKDPELLFRSPEQFEKVEAADPYTPPDERQRGNGGRRSEQEWAKTKAAENQQGGRLPLFPREDEDDGALPPSETATKARELMAAIGRPPGDRDAH